MIRHLHRKGMGDVQEEHSDCHSPLDHARRIMDIHLTTMEQWLANALVVQEYV